MSTFYNVFFDARINNRNIKKFVKRYYRRQTLFLPPNIRNIPIGQWDVSQVTNMEGLFQNLENFNEPLNDWNVSNVTDMNNMFYNCSNFNQPLNSWNVSNVTDMDNMFYKCSNFNQPLNNWDVSNVTNMKSMFGKCSWFNQPLNNWNVSNVTNMKSMFMDCEFFNQPLNNWNVQNVRNMESMFSGCAFFNQPLTNWVIQFTTIVENIFDNCPIRERYKPPYIQLLRRRQGHQQEEEKQEQEEEPNSFLDDKSPLEISAIQINPSTEIGSDLINMERDINVLNFMNEDPKNIAFYFNNQIYLTNKDSLQYSITDPQNKGKNIKYECLITGSMNPTNIVFNNPYFSMRAIGSYGLVSLGQINEIIQNETIRYVEMTTEPMKQLVSTASLQATGPNPNYVSASHCQEGQGENVYNLLNITNISTTGGRKRKYTKKKRCKKIKTRTTNKSKKKSKNTNKK
jgi:surface protein